MPDFDLYTGFLELPGSLAWGQIRAGNFPAGGQKPISQIAHAYAADADKMGF
jgi:hypothetical protein